MLGNPASLGVATGLILAQVGEFSFLLTEQGLKLNLLTPADRQLFLATAIGTLMLAPLFYRFALKTAFSLDYEQLLPRHVQRLAQQLRQSLIRDPLKAEVHQLGKLMESESLSGHTVFIGYGVTAQNVAAAFKSLNIRSCLVMPPKNEYWNPFRSPMLAWWL